MLPESVLNLQQTQGTISYIQDRAKMLFIVRKFFHQKNVMEVDCPALTPYASIDEHIDLIEAKVSNKKQYLHSSPEYGMKKLLANGVGDIYQLSHVFRDNEEGDLHQSEFMMAEWYRIGMSFENMMEEVVDFTRLFLGSIPYSTLSYRQAFIKYTGLDYVTASRQDLLDQIHKKNIKAYRGIEHENKDNLLNIIFVNEIEPHLGHDHLLILSYFPATQSALAQTAYIEEEAVAMRFELYYKNIELANAYHELLDVNELKARLNKANQKRKRLSKDAFLMDEAFLKAHEVGIPDCCGVAVGFDRLMLLRHQKTSLRVLTDLY